MSEDESWRSEAAYDYIDKLTPGDLAWEFLRRNPQYKKSYQELVSIGRCQSASKKDPLSASKRDPLRRAA